MDEKPKRDLWSLPPSEWTDEELRGCYDGHWAADELIERLAKARRANDCVKLLDASWSVTLFRNGVGSYTAVAVKPRQRPKEARETENQITDGFTPADALCRLTEKVLGGIDGMKDLADD